MSRIITATLSKQDNPNISYQLNDLFIRLINSHFDLDNFLHNQHLQASDFNSLLQNLLEINAESATELRAMTEVAQLLIAIIIYLEHGYSVDVTASFTDK